MAILLATYDLKQPGRDYTPVHDYLQDLPTAKGWSRSGFWTPQPHTNRSVII